MKKIFIDTFDAELLASHVTGIEYNEDDDLETIEEKMIENYGCDLVQFQELLSVLTPMIDIGESPLTNKVYKGFADNENHKWFIKTEIK